MLNCLNCGAQLSEGSTSCLTCGAVRSDGGNALPLIAWIFVPLMIPLYPIPGALGTIALAASFVLGSAIGGFMVLLLPPIAVYATVLTSFGLEQRAAQRGGYRLFRNVARLALAGGVLWWAVSRSGSTLAPENALFIAVVGIPVGWWVLKALDRILKCAGPRKTTKRERDAGLPDVVGDDTPTPSRADEFWHPLNHPGAMMIGFLFGMFFALRGGAGTDLSLFGGLLVWIVITGSIMVVQRLFKFVGDSRERALARPETARGGLLRAILLGAIGGAIAGAVLGQTIDNHVEAAHLIIMGVIGVIFSVVVNRIRARGGRPAA